MTLYARSDILVHHNGITGHTHRRPSKGDGTYVPIWGIDCPPCEATLGGDPAWSASRYKIPLTPDEEQEAIDTKAAAEAAMHQAQMAIARDAAIQAAAARGAVPDIDPDDVAVTSGDDGGPAALDDSALRTDPDVLAANYAAQNKTDLKDLARDRGLAVSGSREDLIARHVEFDQQQ